jgi:hypothetical protein
MQRTVRLGRFLLTQVARTSMQPGVIRTARRDDFFDRVQPLSSSGSVRPREVACGPTLALVVQVHT